MGIPHIDTGSEEISSNKKMRGTEKACVGQLCHIEEQLQLYVEESFPASAENVARLVACVVCSKSTADD